MGTWGTWDDNPTTTTLDTRNLQNPQSWVFLETPDTSALLLVRREHITGRSALSKPADRSPTPVSEQRESILSVPVVVTASSVPFVSTPATSPGLLRVSPARSVRSSSLSILPTTSWSEPTPSPDPPSSKSMPLLSVNGTRPTPDKTSVADVKSNSRLVVFSPSSPPAQDRVDVVMDTSWRVRSSLSTSAN